MSQLITILYWFLLAATLPLAAYLYYRTKNKYALAMLSGALLIWGGSAWSYFAEPDVIQYSGHDGAVFNTVLVTGNALGTEATVLGFLIFLGGGMVTAFTNRKSKGNAI